MQNLRRIVRIGRGPLLGRICKVALTTINPYYVKVFSSKCAVSMRNIKIINRYYHQPISKNLKPTCQTACDCSGYAIERSESSREP